MHAHLSSCRKNHCIAINCRERTKPGTMPSSHLSEKSWPWRPGNEASHSLCYLYKLFETLAYNIFNVEHKQVCWFMCVLIIAIELVDSIEWTRNVCSKSQNSQRIGLSNVPFIFEGFLTKTPSVTKSVVKVQNQKFAKQPKSVF